MKILGLPKLIWSIILFIVQIFNFAFLVGAMNFDYWFSQQTFGYNYAFKGQLIKPKTSLYALCSDDDNYQDCYNNCYGSACDVFQKWYSAGVAYIFFDTIGAILVVVAAVFIALDAFKIGVFKKIINLFTTGMLMFVVSWLHFLAFVIWAGVVKLRFSGCDEIDFLSEKVCGEGGAAFAIWNLFYFTLGSPVYFFIARRIKNEENFFQPHQPPMNTTNQTWRQEVQHEPLNEESFKKESASKNFEAKNDFYPGQNTYGYVPPPPSNND